MGVKKISRIFAIVFIIMMVGGIVLTAVLSISDYAKNKERLDTLAKSEIKLDSDQK